MKKVSFFGSEFLQMNSNWTISPLQEGVSVAGGGTELVFSLKS